MVKKDKNPKENNDLDSALADIEDHFGKGSIMRMGDNQALDVSVVPTGSLALDRALGVGGLPRGRITEIYGPESVGKSTMAMHVVAEAQKLGGTCAYVDVENAMDPVYAEALGVDVDQLLISQPSSAEDALGIVDRLVKSRSLAVIVVDSVSALTPRAEILGEIGDSHIGLQARLMSQAMRKITGNLTNSSTICIFINQLRQKVGIVYGSPEITSGGLALKYYASVRLDMRRIESLKNGTDIVGNRTRVKVVKNKVAPPFKQAEFDIVYGLGISKEGEAIDFGESLGLISKSGTWYSYNGEQIAQGKEKAKQYFADNPELLEKLFTQIKEALATNES